VGGALWKLPSLRGHLSEDSSTSSAWDLLRRPAVVLGLAISGLLTAGNFVIIPNISTFLQYNAAYPRENLGGLYMIGGLTSLVVLRLTGRGVDRLGTAPLFAIGSLLVAGVLALGFVPELPLVPVVSIFVVFMGAQSVRNVSLQALLSKVPQQNERARFQSMNSALQHVGSAGGAMFGASLLTETEAHHLIGMPRLAILAMTASLILPAMVYALVRRVDNPR
jgi:predicted MFS family arabinose efflux permease